MSIMNKATITSVKAVKGGKFQIELSQAIAQPSLAALLNKGDDRFSGNKERKAWQSATAEGLKATLGIDVTGLAEGQSKPLNIENPAIAGSPLNIKVSEFTKSEIIAKRDKALAEGKGTSAMDYLLNNEAKTAKQIVKDGVKTYLMKDGETIFSLTEIALGNAAHKFVQYDSMKTEAELEFVNSMAAASTLVGA